MLKNYCGSASGTANSRVVSFAGNTVSHLNFVDFVCIERKLIIEIDGGQHIANREADAKRTAHLERRGYNVLRFWNREVIEDTKTAECIFRNLNSMR